MAISILSFPQPVIAHSPGSARTSRSPAASVLPAPTLRHRGLHLVTGAPEPAAKSSRSSSQSQAERIVAQVEREIALRISRQHQEKLSCNGSTKPSRAALYTLPIAETESPASVARRLFAALLSFARPA